MNLLHNNTLGIDIGSTTVKIAVLDSEQHILFTDYERHYANIQETLALLLSKAKEKLGEMTVSPSITGSGGLTLSGHLNVPFTQEVVAVATALQDYARRPMWPLSLAVKMPRSFTLQEASTSA